MDILTYFCRELDLKRGIIAHVFWIGKAPVRKAGGKKEEEEAESFRCKHAKQLRGGGENYYCCILRIVWPHLKSPHLYCRRRVSSFHPKWGEEMLSFSIVSYTLFDSIQIRVVGENPNLNSRSSKAVTKDPFASIQWGNFSGLDMDYTIVQIFPRKKEGRKKKKKKPSGAGWLSFYSLLIWPLIVRRGLIWWWCSSST